jgi:hypothetical protein
LAAFDIPYRDKLFCAVAAHALSHRDKAGWFAWFIVRQLSKARARGRQFMGFTHCYAAHDRGRLHRNTSRDMLAELEQIGLVKAYKYRPGLGNRIVILRGNVRKYADRHAVKPLAAAPKGDAPRPRTKAEWDDERAAWKEREKARQLARKRREIEEADRRHRQEVAAREAVTDEQRAADVLAMMRWRYTLTKPGDPRRHTLARQIRERGGEIPSVD